MRPVLLFLLLLLTGFSPALLAPSCTITADGGQFTTDNFGNVYLVNEETIRKYNAACAFQKEFSNKNFGPITSADATNALRIVLFYRDFNRVVFLDNTMSQNGEAVQLENLGFPMATLVCSSHDNGLWIFDRQNFELIRLNRNLQVEQRTGNLSQVLDATVQPNFIIEKDNRLFLNNPSTGVLIFDVFGTYSKTIPVKDLKTLQIVDDNLVYYKAGSLQLWNIQTAEESAFEEPQDTSATGMRIEKNAVYVMRKDGIRVYNRGQ
jgi:hypothetical protein